MFVLSSQFKANTVAKALALTFIIRYNFFLKRISRHSMAYMYN